MAKGSKGGKPKAKVAKAAAPPASGLRPLTMVEVLGKLDRVSTFNITRLRPDGSKDLHSSASGQLELFAAAEDARAALAAERLANPDALLELEVVPLGKAFSFTQGLLGLQPGGKLRFSRAVLAETGDSGVPEALRERMASNGPFPIFTVEQLRSPGARPFFLTRADLCACWVKSGRAAEELPPLDETVSDLRVLVAETLHTADAWASLLFMPPRRCRARLPRGRCLARGARRLAPSPHLPRPAPRAARSSCRRRLRPISSPMTCDGTWRRPRRSSTPRRRATPCRTRRTPTRRRRPSRPAVDG